MVEPVNTTASVAVPPRLCLKPHRPADSARHGTVEPVIHDSPNGAAPALALRGLVKRFDAKVAVAGVDLDVASGSFFGLLGPNGAGKTTSLSMAVGLLRPTAGNAYVLGFDVWS